MRDLLECLCERLSAHVDRAAKLSPEDVQINPTATMLRETTAPKCHGALSSDNIFISRPRTYVHMIARKEPKIIISATDIVDILNSLQLQESLTGSLQIHESLDTIIPVKAVTGANFAQKVALLEAFFRVIAIQKDLSNLVIASTGGSITGQLAPPGNFTFLEHIINQMIAAMRNLSIQKHTMIQLSLASDSSLCLAALQSLIESFAVTETFAQTYRTARPATSMEAFLNGLATYNLMAPLEQIPVFYRVADSAILLLIRT